ncbi:DUF2201 family putative metallopeptidase [Actinomadura sp. WAC 06369]|uniref:DUF2201 family putative metallopeptidase n=1 Tax=Actinomadura sp. WAC 06369 TaxID=2203193 RepID=UPI001F41334B|nr:hypothetical protein [Actinomadura sp. WAC 06369]
MRVRRARSGDRLGGAGRPHGRPGLRTRGRGRDRVSRDAGRHIYNPSFFTELDPDGVKFVLFHEARHLMHRHLYVDEELRADPVFTLAAEVSINHVALRRLRRSGLPKADDGTAERLGDEVLHEVVRAALRGGAAARGELLELADLSHGGGERLAHMWGSLGLDRLRVSPAAPYDLGPISRRDPGGTPVLRGAGPAGSGRLPCSRGARRPAARRRGAGRR